MAYSYDEYQGTARPAYMGSQWKEKMELNRTIIDVNDKVQAPVYIPGKQIPDQNGMGRDVRVD